jgi:PAS domain S-box-containing protein
MGEADTGNKRSFTLAKAAEYLDLPVPTVEALVAAGYLAASGEGDDGPAFSLVDLKAFLARNADNGSGYLLEVEPSAVDPQELLEALDGRSEEMARRAYEIFASVFPESRSWSLKEQARFVEQAKARFEAILAVTGQGAEVDEALVEDLEEVGASAAWAGSPLPQILVVLRISRDLVVQTAVELAEARGRHWGMALSLLLTRILPAMDRLTDAIAQGYWSAIVGTQEEARARYENVVEHSSDGVWEVDPSGRIQYANAALALILGRRLEELEGAALSEVFGTTVLGPPSDGTEPGPIELTITRPDGVRRVLEARVLPRRREGEVVGYQGVVRDQTAQRQLEADKNEFLALVTHDLRNPLSVVLGLGAMLESHSAEVTPEHLVRIGAALRRQAERISRFADDLYDVSRLEASDLLLAPRPVELGPTILAALDAVGPDPARVHEAVEVAVPEGLVVLADPRRLEQVVANLVENALVHGAPPVRVEARVGQDRRELEIWVTDHGEGVPDALVGTLFDRFRTLTRPSRDRTRGTGLGLALVKGLVEAMGGRVGYERAPHGGAAFRVVLPTPAPRRVRDELARPQA